MQRSYLKAICLFAMLMLPILAHGVTDKEMEQARVIAAKAYIRYVNDGSGYLDEINPTTLADLEKSLKPKEKENIKAFLAIPVPKDYANWDKQKLVEYWAVTAFQDKGLQEKGRGGRIRARSLINKMNVAAPAAKSANQGTANNQAATTQQPAADSKKAKSPEQATINELDSANAELAALAENINTFDADATDEPDVQKEDNYTWVYIMILAILVVIVIALVIYAVNIMKKSGSQNSVRSYDNEEDSELHERLEAAIADKDLEISMLSKKLETANRQNTELKGKIESLVAEVSSLRAVINASETAIPTNHSPYMPKEEPTQKTQKNPVVRTIYLGRANSKGIFIRADRTINVGHSVYVLDTSDGYSGTFKVADSPAAWSLALSNPQEYLSYACMIQNPEDIEGKNKIITEASGTAIFEGGCWKVIRKAKIRYEA